MGKKKETGVDKTGLVLEGGGLRAVYNAGVLDRFMEIELSFDYVIGTSAGAANAASFLSHQLGRTKRISVNYLSTSKFFSFTNLIKGKPYMNLDYLYDDVTYHLDPLDIEALMENPAEFEVTAADTKTGKTVYFNKNDHKIIKAMRASCALPLFGQKPVKYNRHKLLDGGLTDPIPVKRAVEMGCRKIVVVLTREKAYRKKRGLVERYLKLKYRGNEKLIKAIMNRYSRYNKTRKYIETPPEDVKIFPIYPSKEPLIGRLTRDKEGIKKQCKMGYDDTKKLEKELLEFLSR